MTKFNPNGVGVSNGNIFGFPVSKEEAEILLFPIPWDVTTSYGKGTANGPSQILNASTQLDFYHPVYENAHEIKLFLDKESKKIRNWNNELVRDSSRYVNFLESGGVVEDSPEFLELLDIVNSKQDWIKDFIFNKSQEVINANKIPGVIGGEHSVPLGLLEALSTYYSDFGVLQIDAHADLRMAYEGFKQSHASIFYNALNIKQIKKLVQVGIRDVAQSEVDIINNSLGRITTFFDWNLKENSFNGQSWKEQVNEIISELPNNVYISFDIDGLKPSLCPNTGTPVPGGFELEEINYLLNQLAKSTKKIIGFDLCEVSNGEFGEWDANVGARALWSIVTNISLNRKINNY